MHTLEGEEVRAALKFDLAAEELSVVLGPEDANPDSGIFLSTSEGLAWAGTTEDGDEDAEDQDEGEVNGQNISVWTLGENNPPVWTLTSDINLETTLPSSAISPAYTPSVVGFVEGEGTIFIDSGERIFSVEVGSLESKDIGPSGGRSVAVLPFSHYYMPSMPKESNKKTEAGGYAVEFTEDGVNGSEDKKNITSKAGVIGQKRGLEVETPSDRKPKGEQENFSGADESSTQEKTLGGEDLE